MTIRLPATLTFVGCLLLGAVTSAFALFAPGVALGPRLPLSLAFALFAPGYLLVCTLFPVQRDLGYLARLGLSLASSCALIILLTLALSATPYDRSAAVQLLAMDGFVLLLAAAATWRQQRLRNPEPLVYVFTTGDGSIWHDRFALITLALIIVLAAAAINSAIGSNHGDTTALSIPTGNSVINPITANSVSVNVLSEEPGNVSFQVFVSWQGQVIGQSPPFVLRAGQQQQEQIATTPPAGSAPIPVSVMLVKQGSTTPYRELRVWMRTVPYRVPS